MDEIVWGESDLEVNRGGRLSPTQIDELRRRMSRYARGRYVGLAMLPTFALIVTIALVIALHAPLFLFAMPAIFAVIVAPVVAWNALRVRAVNDDLRDGRVQQITGPVAGIFGGFRSSEAYARIGTTRVQSFGPRMERAWNAPMSVMRAGHANGTAVRAFYLPRSGLLVAAERA